MTTPHSPRKKLLAFVGLSAACVVAASAHASIFKLDDDELDFVDTPPKAEVAPPAPPATQSPPPPSLPAKPAPEPVPASPVTTPKPSPSPVAVTPPKALPTRESTPASRALDAQAAYYRLAHGAFLRGDDKTAFSAFRRVILLAKKQKKELPEETPFVASARVFCEKSRLRAGDAQDKAQAMAALKKFVEENPTGRSRGDALLLLARERMDANDPRGAAPWLVKLDGFIAASRAQKAEEASALPEGTMPPTDKPQRLNRFGRMTTLLVAPGQLVDERTAPWHLDDLVREAAKGLGFVALVKGDAAACKKQWGRLEEPDEKPEAGAAPQNKAPTEATRLGFAARNGRLLAYSGEERLLDAWPQIKERVLYAEFLYLSGDFGQAAQELRDVLAADDKLKAMREARVKQAKAEHAKRKGGWVEKIPQVGLPEPARDYIEVTLGTVLYRHEAWRDSLACFGKVLERVSGTLTERRAVVSYANLAKWVGTQAERAQASKWLDALAASPHKDRFTLLARLNRATELLETGQKQKAIPLLSMFSGHEDAYGEYAKKLMPKQEKKPVKQK